MAMHNTVITIVKCKWGPPYEDTFRDPSGSTETQTAALQDTHN
jgi:hypothetical protein